MVAPAMNVDMWNHPTTQSNLEKLQSLGVQIIEPDEGYLAEGIYGKGRLADLHNIVERAPSLRALAQDFKGETVIVTAGPTCEDIDPVRFLTNRSSGKMGYELARACRRRGSRTILISGPTHLAPPAQVEFVPVRSAQEMREEVLKYFPESTIVIKAAAVADFKPSGRLDQKIKKNDDSLTLELVPNPDILKELGSKKNGHILVGFAAETQNVVLNGRKKLSEKGLDLLVINDVTQAGSGFDADTNMVTILSRDGLELQLGKRLKSLIADDILNEIAAFQKRHV